jgi:hypothetical protein
MSKMSKKRILITLAVMAVMLSLAAAPAMAQSELDQSQPIINQTWRMQETDRQTFTAQKTGTLNTVTIYALCLGFTDTCDPQFEPPVITVEFKGSQSDSSFGSVPLNQSQFGYDVSLDPAPFVEAGKQYAIELSLSRSGQPYYHDVELGGASTDVYPGGEFSAWYRDEWTTSNDFKDLAFQTYVTPDTTAPKVDTVKPTDGAKGVARGSSVTANFSEAVQAATLTSSTVQLFSGHSTKPIKATLSVNPSTNPTSVTLTPSERLDANNSYTAKIKGDATGVKDLAGNPLASDFSWTFTTGGR